LTRPWMVRDGSGSRGPAKGPSLRLLTASGGRRCSGRLEVLRTHASFPEEFSFAFNSSQRVGNGA
jgi:hypothetical protein